MIRAGKFTVLPSATLRDIEPEVKEKWKLANIEFVQREKSTDIETKLSTGLKIGDFDFEHNDIWVRYAPVVVTEQVITGQHRSRRLSAVEGLHGVAARPRRPSGSAGLNFKVEQTNEEFSIEFPKGSSVKDAKAEVAGRCKVPPGHVTLLYNGKALKDAFLLDRLKIGAHPVTVYLKDETEVLLRTVRALRGSVSQ
jgi:hypothetical protein